jgi:hypothetical protein
MNIRDTLAGGLATTAVLCYASLNNPYCEFDIVKELENKPLSVPISSFYDPNPYYQILSEISPLNSRIEIIHKFVSTLIENSKDIDPEFSRAVDKHLWDLA